MRVTEGMIDCVCTSTKYRKEAKIVAQRALNLAMSWIEYQAWGKLLYAEALACPEVWEGHRHLC